MNPEIVLFFYALLVVFLSASLRKITRYEIKEDKRWIKILKKIFVIAIVGFLLLLLIKEFSIRLISAIAISFLWLFLLLRVRKNKIFEQGFSASIILLFSNIEWISLAGILLFAFDSFTSFSLKERKKDDKELRKIKNKKIEESERKDINYIKETFFECINYCVPLFFGVLLI
ncbi:MAG: hypothetical protein PWQ87_875 [Candidatus Woesearchaeota archaeon]|nr:hypothetical protein [Candidatus Woesearchaeota archaeon]